MTSKTVFSPAGEPIEIVPDDEWLALTDSTPVSLRAWHGWKSLVIHALWQHGKFENKSGQATKELADWIAEQGHEFPGSPKAIATLFSHPLNAPAVERDLNGKRTNRIQLVALPERWHSKLLLDLAVAEGEVAAIPLEPASDPVEAPVVPQDATEPPSPVEAPVALLDEARASVALDGETQYVGKPSASIGHPSDEASQSEPEWSEADWEALKVDAPTIYETEPPIELHLANQVAMSLLTTVVEIITAGEADTTKLAASTRLATELDHVQGLLAARLEENNRLRKQLREASDLLTATREERDGLRSRLRATEQNLQAALKGETAHAVNSEIHRRMDEIMRTAPTAKGD